MRIDAYNQIAHMYGAKSKSKTYTVARSNDGSDQVFISSLGRDITVAKKAVSEASDIREDKVDYIKSQIQTGEYKVDPSDFASKLLEKYKATC